MFTNSSGLSAKKLFILMGQDGLSYKMDIKAITFIRNKRQLRLYNCYVQFFLDSLVKFTSWQRLF
jgi:hypothetical protein